MDGIINLLKPTGLTSSDAVVRVRRALSRRDVGHLGTLDPFAAGVLPVAVGKATRLFEFFLTKTKVYRASILFCRASPTLDTDGNCIETHEAEPDFDSVLCAASALVGTYPQIPPAVSAKSVGGVRAYELARQGKTFDLPAKVVTVESMNFVRRDSAGGYVFDVACSAGTYIRAIARDLGAKLGVSAVLCSLIRLQCGEWRIGDCITEEELAERKECALIPIEDTLHGIPRFDVADTDRKYLDNGVGIPYETLPNVPFSVYCGGILYGLGAVTDGKLKIGTYLKR